MRAPRLSIGSPPESLRLTPQQVYARALLGCAEMLRTGTTTAIDDVNLHPVLTEEHVEAVVRAYEDSGMRAVVAAHVFDVPYHRTVPFAADRLPATLRQTLDRAPAPDPKALAELMRACARRFNRPGRRVRFGVGPSGPQRCSDALLISMAEVAEEFDLPRAAPARRASMGSAQSRSGPGPISSCLTCAGPPSRRAITSFSRWSTPRTARRLTRSWWRGGSSWRAGAS